LGDIYSVDKDAEIYLLHCTTNYPTPYEEVNLKAMITLKEAFKLPVGYSDHTNGIEIPVAAVALVTSCAKVPQAALDSAKAALDSAKMVQADVYFPGEFTALNDSLSVMLQNIEPRRQRPQRISKLSRPMLRL